MFMSDHVGTMTKNSKNSGKSNIFLRQKWNSPTSLLKGQKVLIYFSIILDSNMLIIPCSNSVVTNIKVLLNISKEIPHKNIYSIYQNIK